MKESWLRDGSAQWSMGALALCVLVMGAGSGCASSGAAHAQRERPTAKSTAPGKAPASVTTLVARPARRTGAVRPEPPISTRLPSGRVVRTLPVGTRPDGQLAVPHDIRLAGWWRGGSRIGDPFGSTLLAAHVDSFTQGLGPYAELLSARPGQLIRVTSRHLQQDFSVASLRLVPRQRPSLPSWIYTAQGSRTLTLVTCAGPYVLRRGGYQNLAVITATPVDDPTRRAS